MTQTGAPQQAYILWGALLSSTVIILAARLLLPPAQSETPLALLVALSATSFATAALCLFLPGLVRKMALARANIEAHAVEDPNSFIGSGKTLQVPVDRPAAIATIQRLSIPPLILACALAESIALHGFVLGHLGSPLAVVLPFFLVCWALMIFHFPHKNRLLTQAEAATGLTLQS